MPEFVRRAGLTGPVSHRPFPGLLGEVGMARGTRALPGGGSGLAVADGDSGQEARWSGRPGTPSRGTRPTGEASGARSGASRGFRGLQQDRAGRA